MDSILQRRLRSNMHGSQTFARKFKFLKDDKFSQKMRKNWLNSQKKHKRNVSEQICHLEENQELEVASTMLDDVVKGSCHKARWQLESALYTKYDVHKRQRQGIKE